MLNIIGIGYNINHLNLEILKAIENSKYVFLEKYTSFYENKIEDLEDYLQKKIILCDREFVEIEIEEKVLKLARKEIVSFLVIGDPLIATTHTDLILRAKKRKIIIRIFNNLSILNFLTRTGLQIYKFGKITSIPFFNSKFMPRTPILTLIDNNKISAHTLFLLDLNPCCDKLYFEDKLFLDAKTALNFLLDISKLMVENKEIGSCDISFFSKDSFGIICSRLGFNNEKIIFGKLKDLIKYDTLNKLESPICLIIPSKLHDMEKEFLEQFII